MEYNKLRLLSATGLTTCCAAYLVFLLTCNLYISWAMAIIGLMISFTALFLVNKKYYGNK